MTDRHDRGLAFDLGTLLDRRRALQLLGGSAFVALAGACGVGGGDGGDSASAPTSSTGGSSSSASTSTAGCATAIPEETAGPFPGDGTNGPNVLTQSGVVRSDLTTSFGGLSGTATGIPLAIELTIVEASGDCAPLDGAAVYLWHCDQQGRYSLYSSGATDQNYLRGVQVADAAGKVRFTSIFPGAYRGRWPHIHFEVYPTLAEATKAGTPQATSQLALPKDVCTAVYATDGYAASVPNLASTSLTRDGVFGDDGGIHQLATMSGAVADGYTARLTVPV
jgi:protocatechuate 3,4-dioxygenase beta subunit